MMSSPARASTDEDHSDSYRLESSPKFGRYIIAARSLNAGDVIMREQPLVSAPNPWSENVCVSCHAGLLEAMRCPDCASPVCHDGCRMSANHQRECSLLRQVHDMMTDSVDPQSRFKYGGSLVLMALRCLLLRTQRPADWHKLSNLQSHVDERRNTAIWKLVEEKIALYLKKVLADEMPDLDSELVQNVCGIIDVNSFEIRNLSKSVHDAGASVSNKSFQLRGLYCRAAMINHSCVPNAQIIIDEQHVLTLRAQVDIAQGDAILISYTDPLHSKLRRRRFLSAGKYFDCTCRRCQDASEMGTFLSAHRCPHCPDGRVLPAIDGADLCWSCGSCRNEIPAEVGVRTEEVLQNIVNNMSQLPVNQSLIDRCEELFVTLPKKLCSEHAIVLQLKIHLMQLYGNVRGFLLPELSAKQLERKLQLAQELLDVLDHLCPGYSRARGIALYDLHQVKVFIAKKQRDGNEISQDQLVDELRKSARMLKMSLDILCIEPPSSPEGVIFKKVCRELKHVQEMIDVHTGGRSLRVEAERRL